MGEELKIECKWLSRQTGSAIEQSFYADIGLAVGDEWLTLLEDLEASTVRSYLRGCAHHLGMWFAANWWRLRWEPETRAWWKNVDWCQTHTIAGAGGGYVWPNVLFVSDGDSLAVESRPRTKRAVFEPIRYLNRMRTRITAAEFEEKIDLFMERLLSRLDSRQVDDRSLPKLWDEILSERRDPERSERRKLEALAGFDPDDAPDEFIQQLFRDQHKLGKSALEEVTAEARDSVAEVLKPIRGLRTDRECVQRGGFRVHMPDLDTADSIAGNHRHPWQSAAELARIARQRWDLGSKPINDEALANILETEPTLFTERTPAGINFPVAIRKETNGVFNVYLDSRNPTTRRFAVCRMLGDHLYYASQERLLPSTRAKTSRQKFQRAFAQEFLCPINALLERIQSDEPDEDTIAETADFFHVSPLMIRTTLVNKGELDREALAWPD